MKNIQLTRTRQWWHQICPQCKVTDYSKTHRALLAFIRWGPTPWAVSFHCLNCSKVQSGICQKGPNIALRLDPPAVVWGHPCSSAPSSSSRSSSRITGTCVCESGHQHGFQCKYGVLEKDLFLALSSRWEIWLGHWWSWNFVELAKMTKCLKIYLQRGIEMHRLCSQGCSQSIWPFHCNDFCPNNNLNGFLNINLNLLKGMAFLSL